MVPHKYPVKPNLAQRAVLAQVLETLHSRSLLGNLDSTERKSFPVATGFLDYFPDAILAASEASYLATAQHHDDGVMRWDRPKSRDHHNCLLRHFIQRGTVDTDGVRHSTKVFWRAGAILQLEIEAALQAAR